MKYLILLNRKFPYKSGEAFLENEIEEVSKQFDKVYIYPSDIGIGEKKTRKIISENVETRLIEKKDFKNRKIMYLLNSTKYMFGRKNVKSPRDNFIESYFLAAAYSQAKKIIQDLKRINFSKKDKIFLYSYWLYVNAKVGCIVKKYLNENGYNVVLISRAHAFDIYEEKRKFKFLPQRNELFESIDRIYPCSENGTRYLEKKYPKYKEKFCTSYLGTYDHGIKDYSEHEYFNIVSCSRLSNVKRVDLILDSLKTIDIDNLKISWTHIGGGENYDVLVNRSKKEFKNIKVKFIGAISNCEVYDFYLRNDVDLFINVSYSEGLPVSIMEATSFGVPVIATDVGGTSEIVGDDNGFLLDMNFKIEELANLIKKIYYYDSEKRKKLRRNSRKKWEDKFQAEKNYELFAKDISNIK